MRAADNLTGPAADERAPPLLSRSGDDAPPAAEEAPLLGGATTSKQQQATASLEDLAAARNCVYLFAFAVSVMWGVWTTTFTYVKRTLRCALLPLLLLLTTSAPPAACVPSTGAPAGLRPLLLRPLLRS